MVDNQELVRHYDAWLNKYEALRPNGIRDTTEEFVFVGPDGFPLPEESSKKFLDRYDELVRAAS